MKTLIRSHNPGRLGVALSSSLLRPGFLVPLSTTSSSPFISHPRYSQHRLFHIDVAPYFQAGVQSAQDLALSIHHITGLPWAFAIPLFAIGVNLLFRLPFTIQSQLLIQRRSKVAHVLQGWFLKHWHEASREKIPPEQMQKELEKRAKPKTKRIYRALGLQQWKFYLVGLGIPFWIMSLEGIRRLCGAGRFGFVPNSAVTDAAKEGPLKMVTDVTSGSTSSLVDVPMSSDAAAGATQMINAGAQPLDPSLTSEGLLWFTDLTVADPYYILPVCFTALTVLNIIPKDKNARRALFGRLSDYANKYSNAPPSTEIMDLGSNWRVRTIRAILVSSPALVFITGAFPAAVHLYTITSVLTTMSTRAILSSMRPVVPKAKTCKHREMPVIRPALPKRDLAGMQEKV